MPTIIDATVVNQPYDTSGNGGRKLVMLDNGWLVAGVKGGSPTGIFFYVDKFDGNGFVPLTYFQQASYGIVDFSITSKGTNIYMIVSYSSYASGQRAMLSFNFDAVSISYLNNWELEKTLESSLIAVGNTSIAINEQENELHASWDSRGGAQSNSFNIRYAKGTINADGSVTWGAVEQLSINNISTTNFENPTITVASDGYPRIIYQTKVGSNHYIDGKYFNGTAWANFPNGVYVGGSYVQSNPSAIFVPQEIAIKNPMFAGATQGVIAVAWHGADSVESFYNIRFSYSLDGGTTWSAMQKLTTGNTTTHTGMYTSITANVSGEIFVVYSGLNRTNTTMQVATIKNTEGTWGSVQFVTELTGTLTRFPSALFDATFELDFTEPLFIYKGTSKVGFYGTWVASKISEPQGHIGAITDKDIFPYNITSDGDMSEVVEKVNGVVIATKTLASGENTSFKLTQNQWDTVAYGKYSDSIGSINTLTIEMGSNKWTYTFDKRLAEDSDIISIAKATKDTNEGFLPSVKNEMVESLLVLDSNLPIDSESTWEEIINAAGQVKLGKKSATGTVTSPSGTTVIVNSAGSNVSVNYVALNMSNLGFVPTVITFTRTAKDAAAGVGAVWFRDNFYSVGVNVANVMVVNTSYRAPYADGVVLIPVNVGNVSYDWIAHEE